MPVLDSVDDLRARHRAMVLPHLDRLLGFARRRIEPAAADDAVQEACVRAWLAFGELRDATKVRPWPYHSDLLKKDARRTSWSPARAWSRRSAPTTPPARRRTPEHDLLVRSLAELVERMTAHDPHDRPGSAGEPCALFARIA